MSKVIKGTHASGRESMDMILSECLNATNEMIRHGGFAPAQWVLSRHPRTLATMGDEDECLDVSALQEHADGPTAFGVQSRYRAKAREALVRWDCGERVRRAALRKAALMVGSYQVGEIVSYCREPRGGEHGLQWSVGPRLIGFDKDKNSLGETQPRTCWVICDSVFPYALPWIVYGRARLQIYWLSTTCKPKVLHLLQQTLRHIKASSMTVLHLIFRQLLTHRELPMMNKTMKCLSGTQMTSAEAKSGRNSSRVTGRAPFVAHNCVVTCEFITT